MLVTDVVQLVRRGAIEEAIELIRTAFPQLLEKRPEVLFKLQSQHFIELIRQRKKEEAFLFASKQWSPHAQEKVLLEEFQVTSDLPADQDADLDGLHDDDVHDDADANADDDDAWFCWWDAGGINAGRICANRLRRSREQSCKSVLVR